MPKTLILHDGFTCPETLRKRGEKHRGQNQVLYGTTRLGTEATVEPNVSHVFTTNPEFAKFWNERGAKVELVSTLPEGFPARRQLAEAGLVTEEQVGNAARQMVLQGLDGIGISKANAIRKALGMEPLDEGD